MTCRQYKQLASDLKEALEEDREFVQAAVREYLQKVLEEEMKQCLAAGRYERVQGRLGYRAGYYTCGLITRVGKVQLRVPQDREGRFSSEVFQRYQRSERAPGLGFGGDVRQGGFDAQSQADHRAVVRAFDKRCGHQPDQQDAG